MHIHRYVLAGLLAASSVATAQSRPAVSLPAAATSAEPPAVLESTIVRAPGPGLWRVTRGENTLWVFGRVSPLPAGMVWNPARIRSIVASADAVIAEPSVMVGADMGFFAKLALLPSLIGVRDLPDNRSLREVLPPASYARWARLKAQHRGIDGSSEHWRPMFAASAMYDQALRERGLSQKNVVGAELGDALKARGLKITPASATLTIAEPRKAVREFKATQLADVRCFDRVLDQVEYGMGTLAERADAWATGDVAALRRLQPASARHECEDAVLSGSFGQKYGLDTLQAKARARWIAAAEASLSSHHVALSVLPMDEVLAADGVVAALAAKGYLVQAPDEQPSNAPAAPVAAAPSSATTVR
ncbi:TraB/GumN family protein [Cognatilysobacter lacus]|nr:TraB/GumN family protein [Lysobacter lacus]